MVVKSIVEIYQDYENENFSNSINEIPYCGNLNRKLKIIPKIDQTHEIIFVPIKIGIFIVKSKILNINQEVIENKLIISFI